MFVTEKSEEDREMPVTNYEWGGRYNCYRNTAGANQLWGEYTRGDL